MGNRFAPVAKADKYTWDGGDVSFAQDFADVPDQRQDTPWQCGPASFQAALQALTGERVAEADLAAELGTTPEDGTPPGPIIRAAQAHSLQADGRDGCTPADLQRWTAPPTSGLVLCCVQMHGTEAEIAAEQSGHWITVIGCDGQTVEYQDPAAGPSTMPVSEFVPLWRDNDGRQRYVRYGIFLRRA